MNEHIYIPSYSTNSCVTIDNINSGFIRVYDRYPTINSNVNYTDYFVNYNYMSRSGTQSFGNYNVNVNCISHDRLSTDFYYRNDFDSILIIFLIILIIGFGIPFKIITRFFKRFR